ASFRERFRAEARMIAHLRHPNIVQVYDYGEHEDLVYIVMELVEGVTLRDQISGPMAASRTMNVIGQIAAALDYAHAAGVVHRDVKPANILIDAEGRALLTDFGIARMLLSTTGLTREQASIGTPEYMSPEQAAAEPDIGPRSDLYSLGVVAFQLLTGQLPFQADSALAVLHAHIHKPPPLASTANPALPAALDTAIQKALAKPADERFGSGAELADELRNALEGGDGATML